MSRLKSKINETAKSERGKKTDSAINTHHSGRKSDYRSHQTLQLFEGTRLPESSDLAASTYQAAFKDEGTVACVSSGTEW
jgi:hypothetical protein